MGARSRQSRCDLHPSRRLGSIPYWTTRRPSGSLSLMTTSSRRPTARTKRSTLRLPTADAFAALPLFKRTAIFARWLKAQPPKRTYVYFEGSKCPLGRFAQAVYRSKDGTGDNAAIKLEGHRIEVMEGFTPLSETLFYPTPEKGRSGFAVRTFGAASRAFQAALKA